MNRFSRYTADKFLLLIIIMPMSLGLWHCSHENILQSGSAGLPDGYEERNHEGMRYGLFIPPSYDSSRSYPLIISLHGSTDTTSWDLGWYHDPIQSTDPCFVLTPKSLKAGNGWGTSWMAEHSEDMRKTLEVTGALKQEFNLNPNRLYIYGVSMGGFGVFSVLAKEPGMFAAAFVICGGGDPATAGYIAQTPLWIFHGSVDPVVSVQLSRNMYKALLNAGAKHVRYTEYPGVGHAAWTPAWQEPTLESWLLAQERGAAHGVPDTVESFSYEIAGGTQVKLSWHSPADVTNPDNQIWYYKIFRDDVLVAEIDNIETTFVDAGVAVSSTYLYNISAVNYFFKESGKTTTLSVRVP